MPRSAAKPLATRIAPGWEDWEGISGSLAYYLHKGRSYLCGAVQSKSDGTTTGTLLSGLPAEARPAADVPLTLRVIPNDFLANKALDWPRTLAATVHASDGSITLDAALPAWANSPPDPAVWWRVRNDSDATPVALYGTLGLVLLLGGKGWDSGGGAIADSGYSTSSLAPYLGTEFDDVDSWYSAHGTRIHIGGRVRARNDGAVNLFASLPPPAVAGLDVPLAHDFEIDNQPVFIEAGGGFNFGQLETDPTVSPAGQPPFLAPRSPPATGPPINFNTIRIGGGDGVPPGIAWPGDGTSAAPLRTDNTDAREGHGEKWVHGQFNESILGDAEGCPQFAPDGSLTGLKFTNCRKQGAANISLAFTLAELIGMCTPEPDWFLVQVHFEFGPWGPSAAPNFLANVGCLPATPGSFSGGCGPQTDVAIAPDWDGAPLYLPDGVTVPTLAWNSVGGHSGGLPDEGFAGGPVLIKPPASHYSGNPDAGGGLFGPGYPLATSSSLLWRLDQAAGGYTFTCDVPINSIDWAMGVQIWPYYELRNDGLHAGDELNFDGWGWEGPLSGPVMWIA